jgi:hypothetical protein
MNFLGKQAVKFPGLRGGQMHTEQTDLTVFARDYPGARLVLEVKSALSSPPQEDATVKQVAQYMWGANCHYGIIMTPTTTFVLRDDFTSPGPESIRSEAPRGSVACRTKPWPPLVPQAHGLRPAPPDGADSRASHSRAFSGFPHTS